MNRELLRYCVALWLILVALGFDISAMSNRVTTMGMFLLYVVVLACLAFAITALIVKIGTILIAQAQSQK